MKARHTILLSGLLWIWPAFFAAGDPSRQGTPPATQDKLLSSGDILIVQQHLAEFHFNPGPLDGVWHPETTAALRTFQQRYGLPVTGELKVKSASTAGWSWAVCLPDPTEPSPPKRRSKANR